MLLLPRPKNLPQRSQVSDRLQWNEWLSPSSVKYTKGPGPVKTSPSIRTIVNVVGQWEMVEDRDRAVYDKRSENPPCLVFEWMDPDLWNVRAELYREKAVLPKANTRSVLEALDLFASANAMHTGQLYLLRDHFGGADRVRNQSEQRILVTYRQRLSSVEIGRSRKSYAT